jgi:hypothetical protein
MIDNACRTRALSPACESPRFPWAIVTRPDALDEHPAVKSNNDAWV